MKTIGVISDTHGSLPIMAYSAMADCDEIIHAGDICSPDIISELETLAPVHAVLGNNDFPEYGEAVGRFAKFEIDGVRFLVAHKPADVEIKALGSTAVAPGEPIPHVRIHGHTHIPRLLTGTDVSPSDLLMNPGPIKRPRSEYGKTFGKIQIEDGRLVRAWIETLDGDIVFDHEF